MATTISAVRIEAICVRPPDWYWTAVREKEPATGNPEKKAAERLASPRARSSWLESILYFSFVATALATEMDSINPTKATMRAAGTSVRITPKLMAGTERSGNPRGTSPTTPTPRPSSESR